MGVCFPKTRFLGPNLVWGKQNHVLGSKKTGFWAKKQCFWENLSVLPWDFGATGSYGFWSIKEIMYTYVLARGHVLYF